MRLLLVTNDYSPRPGGIQQYLGNLVDAYPYPVRVLAPADGPAETMSGEQIVRRGRRRFMWPTRAVSKWVDREVADFKPDVVLFGAPYPLPALGPGLRKRHGVSFAVLAHGAEITLPAAFPVTRQLIRRMMASADVLLAVSGFTTGRVARLTNRDVTALGAGVDLETFSPAWDRQRGEVPVVGCVSRFVPRKGQHRLVEAAAQLAARGLPVELLFVGRGRLEARLRRMTARRGVPARFEVGVPWDRLAPLYKEMDAFCMPCRSRWAGLEVEGLGMVYLEAAATGLPVLAGTSGGAPETVIPGETGFVVDRVSDIVSGLELVLKGDRAIDFGAAGRERVEREFTWDHVIQRLLTALS